jgi:serine/threonine-protein kinase
MALQAGHLFGNYRIVRQIGEGGFGEVYLAENPLIARRAAVKVLHAALTRDAELVRRFLNEARAASAIRHRNIIEVFDAGVTPEGAPYILMEFLEGVSLHKRLADHGRLALPQVLQIAAQAGSALAAAHAAGIVHRDLKPENLFLVPDPGAHGGELVKILDFGIAKTVGSRAAGGAMRTQAGLIMGSPTYMSPEQCRDSADVDLRSDIYSFATIVYKMLSGRTPYVAASGTEMLLMHLAATPPSLREWVADLPAHVEAAVMRGLARARTDRFDTMALFIGALQGDEQGGASALNQPSSSAEPTAVMEDLAANPEATRTAAAMALFADARPGRWA